MIQEALRKEAAEKSTRKLLVVDDEKKFALLLKKFFAKNGYVVETAYNGLDAGLKASEFLPSIIILDIALPGLNGIEVCRQLKTTPRTQNIHVVAITGNINYPEKSVLAAGADRFFKKPVDMSRLLEECNRLVDSPEFSGLAESPAVETKIPG
jgi:CheY-like chemotaxis protein